MIKQRHDTELIGRTRHTSAKKSMPSVSQRRVTKSALAPSAHVSPLCADALRAKYPRASADAVAFITRAYENPYYRAAMRDLANR